MKECSKSIARRSSDADFQRLYFVGDGVDIGGAPDPLSLYTELFTRMGRVRTWDLSDGDAQQMAGVADDSFDFVHSSHCLEHLHDPVEGLGNWLRIVKPGGHLIITIPDEDLYEQGQFPSSFNRDHKWTFTMFKEASWSERSVNVLDLVRTLGQRADIQRLHRLTHTYRFDLPRYDQTMTPVAESGIEMIIRKRPDGEMDGKGRWAADKAQPEAETRIHLNQYRHDKAAMVASNSDRAPFTDDSEI